MNSLLTTTQFEIETLSIVTKSGVVDISGIFEELNIFDSVLTPCMSGSIVLKDANSLIEKFSFDGTELLNVVIGKTKQDLKIKKIFRLHKLTNRKRINQSTEVYTLHFVSEEFFLSMQQKLSRIYRTTYSEAVVQILTDNLNVPLDNLYGIFDSSLGVKNIVVPNKDPISAINWMSKRAIDNSGVPGFLFFENVLGYNFASLSTLLAAQTVAELNFNIKNINQNSFEGEMFGIRDFEVLQQYDLLNKVKNGVYAGQFLGFDPITRTISSRPLSYTDHFNSIKNRKEKGPISSDIKTFLGSLMKQSDAAVETYPFSYFRRDSNFVGENDPSSLQEMFDTENYILQRKAIFSNLMDKRVKFVIPGNFSISSGLNVFLKVPKYSFKDRDENLFDESLFGNYFVIATRHIINPIKHEVIVEAVSDTAFYKKDRTIYSSTEEQYGYSDISSSKV